MNASVLETRDRRGRSALQSGSAVLFALVACLVAMVSVQVVTAVVVLGERAMAQESDGRALLAATDTSLEAMCLAAEGDWREADWAVIGSVGDNVSGRLAWADGSDDHLLLAETRLAVDGTIVCTRALVERGEDGLDLPVAALVAEEVCVDEGRASPWLVAGQESADDGSPGLEFDDATKADATAYVGTLVSETVVGDGCAVVDQESEWRLDDGWRTSFAEGALGGDGVLVMQESSGSVVRAPEGLAAGSGGSALLLIVLGGVTLDARDLGDVWAVVVADEGSVLLEGTTLHGSVYATKAVDLGADGQVVFDVQACLWARDRALRRTRLVPGSRQEGTS